ncbi:MAG: hypothetical protein ACKVXR_12350 [Planctomycetota bacterium]
MKFSRFLLPGLTAFSLFGAAPNALAGGALGDPCAARRKPGSLLIFPEFDNRTANVTFFTITNTNRDFTQDPVTDLPAGSVRVHMIYVGRYDSDDLPIPCLEVDREILLTPGDTFTFLTRAHNPQHEQGFMYAYATHPTTQEPIVFDYLIGNAVFLNGMDALDYSMNPISLRGFCENDNDLKEDFGPQVQCPETDADGDGNRDLDGIEYEELPDQILIPRFLASAGCVCSPQQRSELILLGLSGGAVFDTVADFLVYNDNEEVFSAQRQFRCWERIRLDVISTVFLQSFLVTTNHAANEPLGATTRESGWIHIDGGVAFSSVEQIVNPAVYAVLVERVARAAGAADLPFEVGCNPNGSLWPNGPLGDNVLGDNR